MAFSERSTEFLSIPRKLAQDRKRVTAAHYVSLKRIAKQVENKRDLYPALTRILLHSDIVVPPKAVPYLKDPSNRPA